MSNNDNMNAACRKYYATPKGRAANLLSSARSSSKKRGLEFDLTQNWIRRRIEAGQCEVTGLPFISGERPWCPSLDRTDPTRGYTKDNVKVVVWMYNSCKGVASHEDVLKFANAISIN